MPEFLHERKDFSDLLGLVSSMLKITPALVEKDYWIMHCLWALRGQHFTFELKGGTSLSKGYGVIQRFSEDIDIRFEPPEKMDVKTGRNQDKLAHIESRQRFYDWLTAKIAITGLISVERDKSHDDEKGRNAGIRLIYPSCTEELKGVRSAVLLEVGFDDTTPNTAVTISSWAFDLAAQSKVIVKDNRAMNILCYNPEYTFVEKLQTISTKYRQWKSSDNFPSNFLRHYYDVYCLLEINAVQKFIGTEEYENRKKERFRQGDELKISKNSAFLLKIQEERRKLEFEYAKTKALYYAGQPPFSDIMARIQGTIERL